MKYISICIFGDGPGRPYDNGYILKSKKIDSENKIIKLYFDGNEECMIKNPSGIVWKGNCLKIKDADKITWKFYYYGVPKTNATITVIEYTKMDETHVHVVSTGCIQSDRVINIKGKLAFDSI